MKWVIGFLFLLSATVYASDEQKASKEIKSMYKDSLKVINTITNKLTKAKTDKEAADAIFQYAKAISDCEKKKKNIEEKYPEYNAQDEISAEEEALQKAVSRFMQEVSLLDDKFPDSELIVTAMSEIEKATGDEADDEVNYEVE